MLRYFSIWQYTLLIEVKRKTESSEVIYKIEDIVDADFQPVFPDQITFENLIPACELPAVKIIDYKLIPKQNCFYFSVNISIINKTRVNLYILVNNKKYDQLYMIKEGTYSISEMIIDENPLVISCFYVLGKKASKEQIIYESGSD